MAAPMPRLYKEITTLPAAFQSARQEPNDQGKLARCFLKERIEEGRRLRKIPEDLEELFA